MTYAENYWQTSLLTVLEHGRKKGDVKYEAMMSDLQKDQIVHQI